MATIKKPAKKRPVKKPGRPASNAPQIVEVLLKYEDGGIAEALDKYWGEPEHPIFERYLNKLAAEIDKAIARKGTR